jgi:hypothetical protein
MKHLPALAPFAALTLAAWIASSTARAAAPPEEALKAYGSGYAGYPLSQPSLSAEGRLVLKGDEGWVQAPKEHDGWIRKACSNWTGAIRSTGAVADPSLVVITPHGGSLWDCGAYQPKEIVAWDDTKPVFTGVSDLVGVPYISVAGQATFGNAINTYGFNLAEGITLYKRQLDVALTVGLVGSSAGLTTSIGGLLRYRIPIGSLVGINIGVNPALLMSVPSLPAGDTTDSPSLVTSFTCGFLGGLNFNVPTGTIDVTASIATNGAYTGLLGHTFFFNVR